MFIPWRTDAPVYYFPWATIGLIVVNALVWVACVMNDYEWAEYWILIYGTLNPLQWVTSNFIHGGLLHLVGNMFFLWGFGLVVEGKLGWHRFLPLFLGLATTQSALEQIVMLGADEGGSLGASAALYGLMAMSMVWAPKNDMSCVLLVFRFVMFDISILYFGLFYIIMQMVIAALQGFAISSEMIHLSGAALGFVIGVFLLKTDQVDCENWDMFALWNDRLGKSAKEHKREQETPADREERLEHEGSHKEHLLRQFVQEGAALPAYELWRQLSLGRAQRQLPREDLVALIQALHKQEQWEPSIQPMLEHLRRFPEHSIPMRLRLSQLLVRNFHRPGQALRVLEKIPPSGLPEKLEQARRQLVVQAKKLKQEGAFELETEDW